MKNHNYDFADEIAQKVHDIFLKEGREVLAVNFCRQDNVNEMIKENTKDGWKVTRVIFNKDERDIETGHGLIQIERPYPYTGNTSQK